MDTVFDTLKLDTWKENLIYSWTIAHQNCLEIPMENWGFLGLIVSTICFVLIFQKGWTESKPNEWLLVLRNGKMVKAGVGVKTYKWFWNTIVKFPSKLERVFFKANNVTIEMQGIVIQGFAFWSVYREQDGPFRWYKYMHKANANSSVQAICESALRNSIANSTINQVLKNRAHLKNTIEKELRGQFKGYGIWLQTIQITDVKISSSSLFKDLQAQFRQETKVKAELSEIQGKQKMMLLLKESEIKTFKKKQEAQTKKIKMNLNQQLKRMEQEQAYSTRKHSLQLQKIVRQREIQLERTANEKQKEVEKLKKDKKIAEIGLCFKVVELKQKIELDKMHNETTMKKYKIDASQRIYNSLTVKDIKINKFGDKSLLDLLPTIAQC